MCQCGPPVRYKTTQNTTIRYLEISTGLIFCKCPWWISIVSQKWSILNFRKKKTTFRMSQGFCGLMGQILWGNRQFFMGKWIRLVGIYFLGAALNSIYLFFLLGHLCVSRCSETPL